MKSPSSSISLSNSLFLGYSPSSGWEKRLEAESEKEPVKLAPKCVCMYVCVCVCIYKVERMELGSNQNEALQIS